MSKTLKRETLVADKEIATFAHEYLEHLLKFELDELDPAQIADYEFKPEEVELIKKCLDQKGVVMPGEKYESFEVLGEKGDDWRGVVTFDYPEGIYAILLEYDMFGD